LNKHGVFTDEDLNMVFKVDKPDMQPHWCYNIDASDLEMRLLQHAIATDVDPKNPVIEFYLNHLHDKFTNSGRDFIKRILAQSMLKNLIRVYLTFDGNSVPSDTYLYGAKRFNNTTKLYLVDKFFKWLPSDLEIIRPRLTRENILQKDPGFQFNIMPTADLCGPICDFYFKFRNRVLYIENVILRRDKLLELGLSDTDAHELKYVFDTANDLPRVEAGLKFHEQKVSNKNVDLSFDNNEVDYSAWDDHSFGDIDYEEEDLGYLSDGTPYNVIPIKNKSSQFFFEFAALLALVTLKYFFD
jgi:hypothetical protein